MVEREDLDKVVLESHTPGNPDDKLLIFKTIKMFRFVGLSALHESSKRFPSETPVGSGFNIPFAALLRHALFSR